MAYRKAGYSKKFREEHEEEILLHQAAKNAFDEMGIKKLPKVKELKIDYDDVVKVRGMDIIFVTTAKSNEEAKSLLAGFGMPFRCV